MSHVFDTSSFTLVSQIVTAGEQSLTNACLRKTAFVLRAETFTFQPISF